MDNAIQLTRGTGLAPGGARQINPQVGVRSKNEMTVRRSDELVVRRSSGAVVQVRSKMLMVGKKEMEIDPYQLIRMIKQVTQTIGEYKDQENPYSQYVVHAMRKARSDMVSDPEHHFHIHWQIDPDTGKSSFYL